MRIAVSDKYSLRRAGFTLTEMLVAIALLMIIMISVATIFRSTGQAVSVGMAITDQNRAVAAFAQQLQQDLVGYADTNPYEGGTGLLPVNEPAGPSAAPFLFIRSVSEFGQPDRATELSGAPAQPFRLDSLGFFTKGTFRRQTGNPGVLVDQMANFTRAFIWYGQLRLLDNAPVPNWRDPGEGTANTNPNNYYANQRILGRRALLMASVMDKTSLAAQVGRVFGYSGPVWYYGRWWDAAQDGNSGGAAPGSQWDHQNFAPFGTDSNLAYPSPSYSYPLLIDNGTTAAGTLDTTQQIISSRYDIIGMNREQSWQDFANIAQAYQTSYEARVDPQYGIPWARRYFLDRHCGSLLETLDIDWASGTVPNNKNTFCTTSAQAVPVLLRSCTNFIVEFAGDYLTQDPATGTVTGAPYARLDANDPSTWHFDGVVDFDIVDGDPATAGVQPVRQIHWYGMPRDTTGDNLVGDGATTVLNSGDVTTVWQMRSGGQFAPAIPGPPIAFPVPFESATTGVNNYYEWGWTKDMLSLPGTGGLASPPSFAPKLIRVTVQVNDPQGRVLEDMTRQYVFPVKHN